MIQFEHVSPFVAAADVPVLLRGGERGRAGWVKTHCLVGGGVGFCSWVFDDLLCGLRWNNGCRGRLRQSSCMVHGALKILVSVDLREFVETKMIKIFRFTLSEYWT